MINKIIGILSFLILISGCDKNSKIDREDLVNGHNYKDQYLPIYLPGNGSLLAAVAMMAVGWDGAPDIHAPGFPQDGSWIVKWEGLRRIP